MKARGWKVGILIVIVAVFVAVAFSVRRCGTDPSDWVEPEVGTDEMNDMPMEPAPDELPPDQYEGSGDEEFEGPGEDFFQATDRPTSLSPSERVKTTVKTLTRASDLKRPAMVQLNSPYST
ncbi:MAG: hypothetical protein R3B54_17780 [Bdellovibrionota bacterium]